MIFLRYELINDNRWLYNLQIFERKKYNLVIEKNSNTHPYCDISMII